MAKYTHWIGLCARETIIDGFYLANQYFVHKPILNREKVKDFDGYTFIYDLPLNPKHHLMEPPTTTTHDR